MGETGGYILILVGLAILFAAYGVDTEANELQILHDAYCGGVMEAFLDWDGDCAELRKYISNLEIVSIILLVFGILLLVSGNNEVTKSKDKQKSKVRGVKLKHYSNEKVVIKPFSALEVVQQETIVTNGFCGKCGNQFMPNSEDNFCKNCGNPR